MPAPRTGKVIRAVKQAVRMPVIGNGDIRSPQDAFAWSTETGCDAVMIGRAASSNPWIFRQIARLSRDRHATMSRTSLIAIDLLSGYFRSLIAAEMPDAIGKMKQFASLFTHGVRNGGELRDAVHHSHTTGEILGCVDSFFAQHARNFAWPIRHSLILFITGDEQVACKPHAA